MAPKTILNVVTFMCVNTRLWTWRLALREGHRLKVFHKRVLRNIFGWEKEASENCTVKKFKTPVRQILLGWWNQRRSNGWGMWHEWEKRQINTWFRLEYLNRGGARNTQVQMGYKLDLKVTTRDGESHFFCLRIRRSSCQHGNTSGLHEMRGIS